MKRQNRSKGFGHQPLSYARPVAFGASDSTIQSIVEDKASHAAAVKESEPPIAQPEPAAATTQAAAAPTESNDLNKLIAEAVKAATAPLAEQFKQAAQMSTELQTKFSEVQQENAALQKRLEAAEMEAQMQQRIAEAQKAVMQGQIGIAQPVASPEAQEGFVTQNVDSGTPALIVAGNGEFKQWMRLREESPKSTVIVPNGQVIQAETREADRFYFQNREKIIESMTDLARKSGLLRGSLASNPVRGAVTVKSDIPDELLAVLSTELRRQNQRRYIFRQFAYTITELGRSPGNDTVKIAKYLNLPEPTSAADYQLVPGVSLVATSDPISERAVACTIEELGRGRNSNVQPIGVASFVSAYTLHDLVAIVNEKLGQNYDAYVDFRIRQLFATATTVLYNNNGTPTDTIGDVTAGKDATMTPAFLSQLFGYMQDRKVPTYEDGYYAIVMHPRALSQLVGKLSERERFVMGSAASGTQADLTTEMYRRMMGPGMTDMTSESLSGYHGVYANFHLFSSNAFGTGSPGPSAEGVQTETIGGGSKTTRTSYAFGQRPIGRGVALPVEIRAREVNDFGRTQSFIWYSHEGYCALDINDVPLNYEDLRVIKVNTTDVEV